MDEICTLLLIVDDWSILVFVMYRTVISSVFWNTSVPFSWLVTCIFMANNACTNNHIEKSHTGASWLVFWPDHHIIIGVMDGPSRMDFQIMCHIYSLYFSLSSFSLFAFQLFSTGPYQFCTCSCFARICPNFQRSQWLNIRIIPYKELRVKFLVLYLQSWVTSFLFNLS